MSNLAKRIYWFLLPVAEPLFALRCCLQLIARSGLVAGLRMFRQLPPGPFRPIDEALRTDQHTLLALAAKHGPIFKCNWRGERVVMIVGFERALDAFQSCPHELRSTYKSTEHLFPNGHLRALHGDMHHHYRQIILRGLRSGLIPVHEAALRADVQRCFLKLHALHPSHNVNTLELINALRGLTTRMLLRVFLGIDPDSPKGKALRDGYDALTPGLAPAFGYQRQNPAFEHLIALVTTEVSRLQQDLQSIEVSVLQRLIAEQNLEPTTRGILVYMLETGRFDLYSLFRWMLYYLAKHPPAAHLITHAGSLRSSAGATAARAFVHETLRLNQSEAIQRRIDDDHQYAGYSIPSQSQLQVCLWETHKDPAVFAQPFEFNPSRFINATHSLDRFAPFGVDEHRCAAAEYVIDLARLFVEEAVASWSVAIFQDAAPVRGNYHWEPD